MKRENRGRICSKYMMQQYDELLACEKLGLQQLIDERAIVCVTVQRGTVRPYYLRGKGIRPEGV